jgi:biotin carboxyl carrier protein
MGGLLLVRDTRWSPEEKGLLEYWSSASAHAIEALLNRRESVLEKIKPHLKKILGATAAVLLILMVMPVSQTVLAPAEVVPMSPFVVRAPVDDVIRKVHVKPNQVVAKGDLLVTIDDSALSARLDVAMQELQIAQAEYRRAEQASVGEREAAAQLPMLRASVERRDAEVAHVKTLLGRTQINSEIDGIAILRDVQELEGKPVRIGEKILTIAKPESAELEFWLMVGDSVPLPEKAEVVMFSNVKPEKPIHARLEYVNYQAELSPEGTLAFRGRAQFTKVSDLPRIGWRGTAKVYGKNISLGYYLFRRPYAAARQWLGL